MSDDFDFSAGDDVVLDGAPVRYRVILDLSEEDAALIDAVAHREGLQPTEALTLALRMYARSPQRRTNIQAFSRLAVTLRRSAVASPQRRRPAVRPEGVRTEAG